MLQVQNIKKAFSPRSVALRGISFSLGRGERVALIGPNGAGKTTLLRTITGLLVPDEGEVRLENRRVMDEPVWCQRRIGYLPEYPPLYPELTPLEQLHTLGKIRRVPNYRERSRHLVESCDLGEVARRPSGRLSRGTRQRVALALSLLHDPQLLILDEPTVGLDPEQIARFRELIFSLSADRLLLLSTHNLFEAETLCTRCLILCAGTLALDERLPLETQRSGEGWEIEWQGARWPQGWPAPVTEVPNGAWKRSRLEDKNLDSAALVEVLVKQGCRVKSIKREQVRLEDIYLKATGQHRRDEP